MQSTAAPSTDSNRSGKLVPAIVFLAGLALTGCFYAVVTLPALRDSTAYRYFCGHPIEECTMWLFCWGMAALGWKAWRVSTERRVLGRTVLPIQPGRAVSMAEVPRLLATLRSLPAAVRKTWFVRRLQEALAYVQHRGSADGLESRLEVLADRDAAELEGSYELVRTVTWAIPILGFLGTVVGITIAIANITPEQLQDSLSDVVGGLAVAFDTTALALALSMGIVLAKFLVERAEQAVLTRVDAEVEDAVLHRFEQQNAETRAFLGAVQGVANVVFEATKNAWREQGQLWTKAIEQVGESQVHALRETTDKIVAQLGETGRQATHDQRYQFADVVKRLEATQAAVAATVTGLREVGRKWIEESRDEARQGAIERASQFAQFLDRVDASQHIWQESFAEVATKLSLAQREAGRQTELVAELVLNGGQIAQLQQSLNQNLAAVANVQALDEAIHSLAAAAHLLTARAGRAAPGPRLAVPADAPAEVAA